VRIFRVIMIFFLHQCLSTIGVIVGVAFVVFSMTSVSHHWQEKIGNNTASLILTGMPGFPGFPIQAAIGLVLGWWLMKRLGQNELLWVWVLPAVVMLIVLIHGPVVQLGNQSSYEAVSHFFGNGCRPQDRCFDQVIFTLPLCTAAAYSLGAAFRKLKTLSVIDGILNYRV
jgi:hypothetical protein